VKDETISQIGPSESVQVPAGATVIDGEEKVYLMPGLTDMHTHLRYETDLQLYLANGVTLVRSMNGRPYHIEWRDKVAHGQLLGPDIVTAGPILGRASNGHVDLITEDDGVREVDKEKAEGYDFIKVYDELPKAAYLGVVKEARRVGMPVAGHVNRDLALEGVLDNHQASVEHAEQIVYHFFGHDYDESKIPYIASRFKEAGSYLVPTAQTIPDLAQLYENKKVVLDRPEVKYVQPETLLYWASVRKDSSAENRALDTFQGKIINGFEKAGVPMLTGTDSYLFGAVMGFSLHREFKRLSAAGLTNYQILEMSTKNAGEYLHRDLGTIRVGARANLLLVDGDPTADLEVLSHPYGVFVQNQWLPRVKLEVMLADIAKDFEAGQRFIWTYENSGVGPMLDEYDREGPFSHEDLVFNEIGNDLTSGQPKDAVRVLERCTKDYPNWWYGFDSLGDAYRTVGNKQAAIDAYKRSLTLNPKNRNAVDWIKKLSSG